MTLAILMAFYLISFLDKQIFSLLGTLIQKSLGLDDVKLGLLQGFIFSIPYSLGALLVGWAIDRYSKRWLLFFGLLVWSLAAASSGLATSFATMAGFRAAVGLGEAVLMPTSLALIATVFPRDRVPGAIGIFYAGAAGGGVIAMLLGGRSIDALMRLGDISAPWVGALKPWQAAFMLTGLPGLLVAFLAFGIRARDARPAARPAAAATGERAADTLATYFKRNGVFFASYLSASAGLSVCAYSLISWMAPYLERAFGWSHTVIGQVMALGIGVGGCGNVGWGILVDRVRRRGHPDALFKVFIPMIFLGVPISAVAFLIKNPLIFLPAYALTSLVFGGYGALIAAIQLTSPAHLRGRLTGLQFVWQGFVGLGVGPVVAGFFTEHVFHSRAMLGPAIFCAIALGGVWTGVCLMIGQGAFRRAVCEQDENALTAP